MGSSSPSRMGGMTVLMIPSLLQFVSLQIFLLTSAGYCCCSRNSASTTALQSAESYSWLRRLGVDEDHLREPSSQRDLLQTLDSTNDFPFRAPTPAGEGGEVKTATSSFMNVNQFGTGDYQTVQEAIDAVPSYNTKRVVIRVFSGTYREKVYIRSDKAFITLLGIGDSPPVITWNDTAASVGTTWESGTVSVDAAHFIAKGITFQNTAPAPAPGAVGAQAIALRIGGDMAAFYECSFLGAQDTLCDWMGRHYFRNCFIQGSIDFIFGAGQSLYERCLIHSIAAAGGAVTAHYRQSEDSSGYSFVDCNITGTGQIFLGRAWGPYSRVVFSNSNMADVIDPRGWGDWGSPSVDKSVYYGEYNNFGPGSNFVQRVPYARALSKAEAEPFLTLEWIKGGDWLDVPERR